MFSFYCWTNCSHTTPPYRYLYCGYIGYYFMSKEGLGPQTSHVEVIHIHGSIHTYFLIVFGCVCCYNFFFFCSCPLCLACNPSLNKYSPVIQYSLMITKELNTSPTKVVFTSFPGFCVQFNCVGFFSSFFHTLCKLELEGK